MYTGHPLVSVFPLCYAGYDYHALHSENWMLSSYYPRVITHEYILPNQIKQVTLVEILNLIVKPNYTGPTYQLQLLLSLSQLSPTLFTCFDIF